MNPSISSRDIDTSPAFSSFLKFSILPLPRGTALSAGTTAVVVHSTTSTILSCLWSETSIFGSGIERACQRDARQREEKERNSANRTATGVEIDRIHQWLELLLWQPQKVKLLTRFSNPLLQLHPSRQRSPAIFPTLPSNTLHTAYVYIHTKFLGSLLTAYLPDGTYHHALLPRYCHTISISFTTRPSNPEETNMPSFTSLVRSAPSIVHICHFPCLEPTPLGNMGSIAYNRDQPLICIHSI